MTKAELDHRTDAAWQNVHDALLAVYEALNAGQKKQLIKNESVKVLFDRYGVIVGE